MSSVQEIELSLLKDRMNDNEEREARSLGAKNKKVRVILAFRFISCFTLNSLGDATESLSTELIC